MQVFLLWRFDEFTWDNTLLDVFRSGEVAQKELEKLMGNNTLEGRYEYSVQEKELVDF